MLNYVTTYNDGKYVATHEYELIFLLMQDGIKAGAPDILKLDFTGLDAAKSWAIVAGVECEGQRRVIGPVVTFNAKPGAKFYRLTSDMDGYNRLVGHVGDSVEVIVSRLTTIAINNGFDDHANLSKITLWECDE